MTTITYGDTEAVARATFRRMHPDARLLAIEPDPDLPQDPEHPWQWVAEYEAEPMSLGL